MQRKGFTLVELLVVLAIVALMMTIAAPRYIDHVERSRETALKASLKVMREAIDHFEGDTGRLPANLEELVARRYLREIPVDPVTDRRDTWIAVAPSGEVRSEVRSEAASQERLADVRSGAPGNGRDDRPFHEL